MVAPTSTKAISSGPNSAPNWSSASCTPNAHPYPMFLAAWESIASRGGLRMPFPIRSAMISTAATCQLPASASSGTTDICRM